VPVNRLTRGYSKFLEIFWGGRDFTEGVAVGLLSITEVLGTGGE
jgi:hypothetical protein